jgi:uncharacterized protein YegL
MITDEGEEFGEPPPYPEALSTLEAEVQIVNPTQGLLRMRYCGKPNLLPHERSNTHLVMVLDVSGSMERRAVGEQGGTKTPLAYYQLDLAVHAVKAMARRLSPGDVLTVLAFSDSVAVVADCLPIDGTTNFEDLTYKLDALKPESVTNMGPAIDKAFDRVGAVATACVLNNVVVFLTDGQPTDSNEHARRVKRRVAASAVPLTFHTVAFGQADMDVKMLRDMAVAGGGLFYYIDGTNMVGTVASALMASVATETHNSIVLTSTAIGGYVPHIACTFGTSVSEAVPLGSLSFDRERVVLLTFPEPIFPGAVIDLMVQANTLDRRGSVAQVPVLIAVEAPSSEIGKLSVSRLVAELVLAHSLGELTGKYHQGRNAPLMLNPEPLGLAHMYSDLQDTLEAQVKPALSQRYWHTWGERYTAFLASGLAHQTKTNFKCQAVQRFGTPEFQTLYDQSSDVFDTIKLREPRVTTANSRGSACTVLKSAASINQASGGCYHGNSSVVLDNGTEVKVADVEPGARLAGGTVVRMILETVLTDPTVFVQLGGLLITLFHPVRSEGQWVYAHQAKSALLTTVAGGVMRSFLLEDGIEIEVEGVWTAALGHGVKDVPVLSNPFWGDTIRTTMQRRSEQLGGAQVITVNDADLVRNADGAVCGMQW